MEYRHNPPQTGINMQLEPLMNASWIQALEDKYPDNKRLGQITELI